MTSKARVHQETQQAATVVMAAEFVEQRLIIGILQAAVAQLIGHIRLQGFSIGLKIRHLAVVVCMLQRECVLQ